MRIIHPNELSKGYNNCLFRIQKEELLNIHLFSVPEGFKKGFIGSNKKIPCLYYEHPVTILISPTEWIGRDVATQIQPDGKTIILLLKD